MKKQRRNPYQHIVDYYDRLIAEEHHEEEHPSDCRFDCGEAYFSAGQWDNLVSVVEQYFPLKYKWAYQFKRKKNETDEEYDKRHRASGVQKVPDLDASIALYKYPAAAQARRAGCIEATACSRASRMNR